jgi:hypothetical protein
VLNRNFLIIAVGNYIFYLLLAEDIVLNLNELSVFLTVAETNSFSAAGREVTPHPACHQPEDRKPGKTFQRQAVPSRRA